MPYKYYAHYYHTNIGYYGNACEHLCTCIDSVLILQVGHLITYPEIEHLDLIRLWGMIET